MRLFGSTAILGSSLVNALSDVEVSKFSCRPGTTYQFNKAKVGEKLGKHILVMLSD